MSKHISVLLNESIDNLNIKENGVYVDEEYGQQLFNLAIDTVLFDVEKLLDRYEIRYIYAQELMKNNK